MDENAGEYLERIRRLSVATGPNDPVFTTSTGKSTKVLYAYLVEDMLEYAGLRDGPSGIPRSTYCFRHTYATLRLSEGVDVYFLAEQMGTSVKMIEDHYGHVNTIKHADRVLQGMGNWAPPAEAAQPKAKGKAAAKVQEPANKKAAKQTAADAKAARRSALRQGAAPPKTRH